MGQRILKDPPPVEGFFILNTRRCVLFLNGLIYDYSFLHSFLNATDVLIAVDGGLKHLAAADLNAEILIGDLDSVPLEDLHLAEQLGVEILRFPVEKDETDFELALELAVQRNFDPIVIVGGLGGRLDHTLGNIFLLANPKFSKNHIRFEDGQEEVFMIDSSAEISGEPGDRVSLLPISDCAVGVQTEGLQYQLCRETLEFEKTRGISNVMLSKNARVTLDSGHLLCIHTHTRQIDSWENKS